VKWFITNIGAVIFVVLRSATASILKCLDNHEIGGSGSLSLGQRDIYTRDLGERSRCREVFICEGIIDYLSIKTLEKGAQPGLAF